MAGTISSLSCFAVLFLLAKVRAGFHPISDALERYTPSGLGSCAGPSTSLNVASASDFAARTAYSNNSIVVLFLQNNITLTSTLSLTSSYSCTIVTSASGATYSIGSNSYSFINVLINGVTSMIFYNVNLYTLTNSSQIYSPLPSCSSYSPGGSCPALFIQNSFNVQITNAVVFGRIDVTTSAAVTLDYLNITGYSSASSDNFKAYVRVLKVGSVMSLTRSAIQVTNCYMQGSSAGGVSVYGQAVGVTVENNYIANVTGFAVQCGANQKDVGDCMLSSFTNNVLVQTTNSSAASSDSGGVVMNYGYVSPGNLAKCNYITGFASCIYAQPMASGITVQGGVCISCGGALKFQYPKAMVISSMILDTQTRASSYAYFIYCDGCKYTCNDNLYFSTSTQVVTPYYVPFLSNSSLPAAWPASFPWLTGLCSFTSILGISCNPTGTFGSCSANGNCVATTSGLVAPYSTTGIYNATAGNPYPTAAATGACSGIPYLNYISSIAVSGSSNINSQCCYLPSEANLNYFSVMSATVSSLGLTGGGDYGASSTSAAVYSLYPGFVSCPLASVGVQSSGSPVALAAKYVKRLGRRKPLWFKAKN